MSAPMDQTTTGHDQYEQVLFDAGMQRGSFSYHGATRDVYRMGEGPPVIVLCEFPGITPQTVELCGRIAKQGYEVVLPQLFGVPGAPMLPKLMARSFGHVCVSREFALLAERKESPISEWLRALARYEHKRYGGRGVGVIGMCFTGGFALAMAVDESVTAPVLAQPSLPFALTAGKKAAVGLDEESLQKVKERCERDDLCVLGLRFSHDAASPKARFKRLTEALGDRFVGVEIDSSFGNRHGIKPWAHSVLTLDYVDDAAHPTHGAFQRVLEHFKRQLPPKN